MIGCVSEMESPNMYDSQAHQVGQQQLQAELKKSAQMLGQPGQAGANGNGPGHNNNNSNLAVNHNHSHNGHGHGAHGQQTGQQQAPNGVSKVAASKASVHQQYAEHCAAAGELTDLNTPEISLDLQHLIDDSHFNDGLLDMLGATSGAAKLSRAPGPVQAAAAAAGPNAYGRAAALAYMPQPVHSNAPSYHHAIAAATAAANSCSDSNSSSSESPSIKEEPLDPADFRRHCAGGAAGPQPTTYGYPPQSFATPQGFGSLGPAGAPLGSQQQPPHGGPQHGPPGRGPLKPGLGHHQSNSAAARKQNKCVDKASDEYRRRRERNNIAVRKSREKAKVRSRETEERVKHLNKENEVLRKKVEILTEELGVMRSLLNSVGGLPEQLHREISRHLDQFQQHVGSPM